jgi:hypothetical protein
MYENIRDTLIDRVIKETAPVDDKSERFLKKAQKAWKISENYFDNNLKDIMAQRYKMYNSKHLASEKCSEEGNTRSNHYVPKSHEFVKNSVSQVVSAYFLNADLLYLNPESSEDVVACMSSEYFTYLLNKRLKSKNNWWLTFIQMTAQSGFIHNMSIAKVDWDVDKKESIAVPIMLERFRVDPHADPLDPVGSSAFLIHQTEMYVDDLRAKQKEDGWLSVSVEDLQANFVSKAGMAKEEVSDARFIDQIDPRRGSEAVDDELEKVFVNEVILRENGKYYVFFMLGTDKILTKIFTLKEIYPQGLPFVMAPIFPEEMKIYATSPLDHAYPAQRILNEMTNLSMDAAYDSVYGPLMVKSGRGIDVKRVQKRGRDAVFEVKAMDDVSQFNRQTNTMPLKNEIPILMNNFDSVVGGLPNSTVSLEGGETTATGQNMRYRSQSQVINMYLMNYNEKFIEPVLNLMIACERINGLANEKEVSKVFRALNLMDKYTPRLIAAKIDPATFEIDKAFADAEMNLSVNVGMGATSPQMRVEQFLASLNAIGSLAANPGLQNRIDLDEVDKEIMSLNGYKDYKRFMRDTNDEDPRIAEKDGIIQQLQAKLAEKKSPEEVAADVALKNASAQDKIKKLELVDAQVANIKASTVVSKVDAQIKALEGAAGLMARSETAIGADKLLENAGYEDPTPEDPLL